MERRAPATSPNTSQPERKAKARWWKTPAVIAVVITALAAIDGALIPQCTASTPQRSDAPPTKQETHGPNSPAVTGVQGDVTIIYGISEEKFQSLAEELGVTRLALKSFFNILEQQQGPLENLDSTLRDIAKRYKALQGQLQALSSNDPEAAALKQAASKALDAGDFAQAEQLLNEASQKDLERAQRLQGTIQHLQEEKAKSLLSAAAFKAENGALQATQLRYVEAAIYYRQAVELVETIPIGSEATLATYLNEGD
jgi:tetratricopeptide (TPR) repeat protein